MRYKLSEKDREQKSVSWRELWIVYASFIGMITGKSVIFLYVLPENFIYRVWLESPELGEHMGSIRNCDLHGLMQYVWQLYSSWGNVHVYYDPKMNLTGWQRKGGTGPTSRTMFLARIPRRKLEIISMVIQLIWERSDVNSWYQGRNCEVIS